MVDFVLLMCCLFVLEVWKVFYFRFVGLIFILMWLLIMGCMKIEVKEVICLFWVLKGLMCIRWWMLFFFLSQLQVKLFCIFRDIDLILVILFFCLLSFESLYLLCFVYMIYICMSILAQLLVLVLFVLVLIFSMVFSLFFFLLRVEWNLVFFNVVNVLLQCLLIFFLVFFFFLQNLQRILRFLILFFSLLWRFSQFLWFFSFLRIVLACFGLFQKLGFMDCCFLFLICMCWLLMLKIFF